MNNFWDERFGHEEYAYGIKPNQYFKQELEKLTPGKILLPAEGEGRNAVFAAKLGWQVTAFDSSFEGKKKAEKLAKKNSVSINYILNNYEEFKTNLGEFDCVALIFAHMQPNKRNEYHKKITALLEPAGTLILEGFSKKQINNNTGGPKNIDMLFSSNELQNDFESFSKLNINETETTLDEGQSHQGVTSVIRVLGIK
ncbi:MAG: methyltransferase domain-containing protein [Draconibacterium sp.]|nr:methyltransferase domain-containing protein [Draconibacterium sp.]